MQRRVFRWMFEELGDLYGHQWEQAEAIRLRDECEEFGIPMGYGRVGRTPQQLTVGETAPVTRISDLEESEEST